MTATARIFSTADQENFDLAVQWAEVRFGQDARIQQIAQYGHHADTMIRVEGYDSTGRYFRDERYVAELAELIEKAVAERA